MNLKFDWTRRSFLALLASLTGGSLPRRKAMPPASSVRNTNPSLLPSMAIQSSLSPPASAPGATSTPNLELLRSSISTAPSP